MNVKRIVTAAVALPLFALYVMKLPPVYFAVMVSAVSAVALHEFCSMYGVTGRLKYPGVVLGFLMPLGFYAYGFWDVLFFSFIAVAAARLFIRPDPSSSLRDVAPVVLGLVYIPGLLGFQISLREADPGLVLYLYGSVWTADAFAYYIGKGIGGRKLYEAVSPNKTMAGGAGSVAGGAAGALLIKYLLLPDLPPTAAALTGAVIGAVTVLGDLVESMFKRDAGVKDSGSIVPGHGGLLDKIDGSVFAGPALFWMLTALRIPH
jgi:phosphatidate cytidylyltransferase